MVGDEPPRPLYAGTPRPRLHSNYTLSATLPIEYLSASHRGIKELANKEDIPEIIEGQAEIPRGTPRVERTYLEEPQDEMPVLSPTGATGIPQRETIPLLLNIKVTIDPRDLLGAIDNAVKSNNIDRVINILRGAKIEAEKVGPMLVVGKWIPGK